MKSIILLACSIVFFSSNAVAVMNNSAGNSTTGPNVECTMPDGTMKYIPILICKYSNGTIKY